jgi:hypothetical protein
LKYYEFFEGFWIEEWCFKASTAFLESTGEQRDSVMEKFNIDKSMALAYRR